MEKNRTINDQPVTDDMVEAWADEAERGYDIEKLPKRGRPALGNAPAKAVPVRFEPELLAALDKRAEQMHLSRSAAVRQAVAAWSQS